MELDSDGTATARLAPLRYFALVLAACTLPALFMALGADFATPNDIPDWTAAQQARHGTQIDLLHHSLGGSFTHTILEWSAFATAIFTVILAFVHFAVVRDIVTPIIAVALYWAGCMDAFHTLAADRLIDATAPNENLIPFTWAICRTFKALIPITGVSILLLRNLGDDDRGNIAFVSVASIAFGVIAYAMIQYCAGSESLPRTMFEGDEKIFGLITRPYDVIPLALFVLSGVVVYPLLNRLRWNYFALAMWLSVIPDGLAQMHMAFGSATLFDSHFNVAHFLKIWAYFVPFVGLSFDYVRTYRGEREAVSLLEDEIAERVRAEEALDETEERLGLAVRGADLGLWDWHVVTNRVVLNERSAEILGIAIEDLDSSLDSIQSFVHPEDFARVAEAFRKHAAKDAPFFETEHRVITSTGDSGWVLVRGKIVERAPDGAPRRVSGTYLDISDRKRTEAELVKAKESAEAASRAKSDFLTTMSHEIRTPLTAVIGYAGLLSRQARDPAQNQEWTKLLRGSADHLLTLVSDILDVSKIEAGELVLKTGPCSVSEIIEGVASVMRPDAVDKKLSLEIAYESAVPRSVQTDSVRFRQIVFNLVGNAIKFTEKGSIVIRVGVQPADDPQRSSLSVAVEDTGIGISPNKLELIFAPFTQIDMAPTRRHLGTGLGLDICRRLVGMLGGTLSVDSEVGKGSVFTMNLDIGPTSELDLLDRREIEIAQPHGQPWEADPGVRLDDLDVLLVEDGRDNQRIVSFLLEEAGARVEVAENGVDGVEAVMEAAGAGLPFQLILMDVQMPVMDGLTATSALRNHGVETPIIALTAYATSTDQEKCLSAGCNAYISKPILPEQLFETIAQQLEKAGITVVVENDRPTARLVSTMAGDETMTLILEAYLAEMPATIETLSAARAAGRVDQVQRLTHQIRGAAGGYGFQQITEAAAACEDTLGNGGSMADIEASLDTLLDLMSAAIAD